MIVNCSHVSLVRSKDEYCGPSKDGATTGELGQCARRGVGAVSEERQPLVVFDEGCGCAAMILAAAVLLLWGEVFSAYFNYRLEMQRIEHGEPAEPEEPTP